LRGLSSRVGIGLFDRTARAVALTEEGRSYYQRVKPVCTENSNPDVVVMESAEDLERFDAPGPLNRARDRRILIQ